MEVLREQIAGGLYGQAALLRQKKNWAEIKNVIRVFEADLVRQHGTMHGTLRFGHVLADIWFILRDLEQEWTRLGELWDEIEAKVKRTDYESWFADFDLAMWRFVFHLRHECEWLRTWLSDAINKGKPAFDPDGVSIVLIERFAAHLPETHHIRATVEEWVKEYAKALGRPEEREALVVLKKAMATELRSLLRKRCATLAPDASTEEIERKIETICGFVTEIRKWVPSTIHQLPPTDALRPKVVQLPYADILNALTDIRRALGCDNPDDVAKLNRIEKCRIKTFVEILRSLYGTG